MSEVQVVGFYKNPENTEEWEVSFGGKLPMTHERIEGLTLKQAQGILSLVRSFRSVNEIHILCPAELEENYRGH